MIYSILFFLSGFAGLLYQIVWLRLAFGHFGIITPVLSTVVSVFMLGLGVGSWAAGSFAGKRSGREAFPWLRAYGLVELGVGVWAAFVPKLMSAGETFLLGTGTMNSGTYLAASALTLSAAIFPSCLLMGMTYPLMMAHWRQRSESAETSFSYLYRANVLGALAGALLTPLVFIELWGFRWTNRLGVLTSLSIAGISFIVSLRHRPAPALVSAPAASPVDQTLSARRILAALFVTGFVSMAYEVLWTRAFTMILGSTIYSFATIVVVYLAATWLGSCLYRLDLSKGSVRPMSLLYGALSLSAFLPIFINDPRARFGMPGVSVSLFPFCALLGYITSSLMDRYSMGRSEEAGRAYAVNIAGCVIGPLIASYLLLPTVGARIGMLWLSFPVLLLAMSGPWVRQFPRTTLGFLGIVIPCVLFARDVSLSFEDLGSGPQSPSIVRRDYVATVVSFGKGFDRNLLVNGIGITSLTPLTKTMAHLPILCHRGKPESALVICFGMGTTYRSLLSWGLKTTAVELVPSVPKAFGYYFEDADRVMQNPLGHVVIDDGRRFLQRTTEMFDIITLDPPPPVETAGSGLLYSPEFYALAKKRLKPDGILQQWWPGGDIHILYGVVGALRASFPYVHVYKGLNGQGFHFLASRQEIDRPPLAEALRLLPPGAQQDILEWNPGWALPTLVGPIFAHELSFDHMVADSGGAILTDDHPLNEYYLLRRWAHGRMGKYDIAH